MPPRSRWPNDGSTRAICQAPERRHRDQVGMGGSMPAGQAHLNDRRVCEKAAGPDSRESRAWLSLQWPSFGSVSDRSARPSAPISPRFRYDPTGSPLDRAGTRSSWGDRNQPVAHPDRAIDIFSAQARRAAEWHGALRPAKIAGRCENCCDEAPTRGHARGSTNGVTAPLTKLSRL